MDTRYTKQNDEKEIFGEILATIVDEAEPAAASPAPMPSMTKDWANLLRQKKLELAELESAVVFNHQTVLQLFANLIGFCERYAPLSETFRRHKIKGNDINQLHLVEQLLGQVLAELLCNYDTRTHLWLSGANVQIQNLNNVIANCKGYAKYYLDLKKWFNENEQLAKENGIFIPESISVAKEVKQETSAPVVESQYITMRRPSKPYEGCLALRGKGMPHLFKRVSSSKEDEKGIKKSTVLLRSKHSS